MSDVQTMRPTATVQAGDWTAEPSGTLHGVTSDDSDSTFAESIELPTPPDQSITTSVLILNCGTHTPPAGHERHRIRTRFRAANSLGPKTFRSQSQWQLGGSLGAIQLRNVTSTSPVSQANAWLTSPSATGGLLVRYRYSGVLVTAPTPPDFLTMHNQVMELYVDVDSRAAPAFSPLVIDGAGVTQNGGTVTDSTVPRFVFDGVNYDGLPARDWQVFLYTLGQTTAGGFVPFATTPFRQVSGVGAAPSDLPYTDVGALPNGQYVAYFRAASTIRGADPYLTVQSVAFEMDVETPPAPVLTVTVDAPNAEVCWTPDSPTGTDWDNSDEVVVEVQRSDCFRDFFGVHTAPSPLTNCFTDRFVPLFDENCPTCDEDEDDYNCEVIYRARYWGMVGGILMSTDWGVFP